MLDDLKYIHERDTSDALGIAEKQWQQLNYSFPTAQTDVDVDNLVFAGMGGSALAGLISQSWPAYQKPFELVRNYNIPQYVSPRTYFIVSSYSGNTEETLTALAQAEAKGAKIAVIANGGKLAELAKDRNYPLALIPKTEQPRYAVFYSLKALLSLLVSARLLREESLQELTAVGPRLQAAVSQWLPTVPVANNPAKLLALECIGKSIVMYAGPSLYPAAYKWKISFNEKC